MMHILNFSSSIRRIDEGLSYLYSYSRDGATRPALHRHY